MAACKENYNPRTFPSVLKSLLVQKDFPSISIQGALHPLLHSALHTLLNAVGSRNVIGDGSKVSSNELSHEIKNKNDVSANYSRGSGKKK